jgi:DNA polymerase III gamma/tau subunit
MQIGVVSDDELLDLLDLALSSDSSNTVIRARELMRSRIDPMQLISQLANLIMDILAGKSQEGSSEVKRKFSTRHNCKYYTLSFIVWLSYFTRFYLEPLLAIC